MYSKKVGIVGDLNNLERFCENIRAGELTVISGAAGTGKTHLTLKIAAAYIGLRKSSGLPPRVLVMALNHDREFFAAHGLCRDGISIEHHKGLDLAELEVRCRAVKSAAGMELLVVDTLQLLRDCGDYGKPAWTKAIAALRRIAFEHEIPVLLVSSQSETATSPDAYESTSPGESRPDMAVCLTRNTTDHSISYCLRRG